MLALILADEGYRVVEAAAGQDPLKFLAPETPDPVLTDLMMPRGAGQALVQGMHENPRLMGIPVVLVSAQHGIPPDGPVGVIFRPKPFELDQLLIVVAAPIGRNSSAPVG